MLEVHPKTFADALSRVMAAVEKSKESSYAGHVLILVSGSIMTLRATEYSVEIATMIECSGELEPICAPADRLQSTVSKLVDRGFIRIALDGAKLTISSGASRFTMPTLPPEPFPSIALNEVGSVFDIEGKALATLFKACEAAIATKDDRRMLEGLCLFAGSVVEGGPTGLCAIATDGHKLLARQVKADLPEPFPTIVVPRKTVGLLGGMVSEWNEVNVEVTDTRIIVQIGTVTRIVAKLIEATYPDWRRVLPKVPPTISYDSDELRGAASIVFAAVRNDKKRNALRIEFGGEATGLSISNKDGTAEGSDTCRHSLLTEALPLEFIGLNPEYLLEVLDAFGADTVQFGLSDNSKTGILLTSPNLADRIAVIVPMLVV
jgi:DNA polymerase-3 subunit beta